MLQKLFLKGCIIPTSAVLPGLSTEDEDATLHWFPLSGHACSLCVHCGAALPRDTSSSASFRNDAQCTYTDECFCSAACEEQACFESFAWFFLHAQARLHWQLGDGKSKSKSPLRDELLRSLAQLSPGDADLFLCAIKLLCALVARTLTHTLTHTVAHTTHCAHTTVHDTAHDADTPSPSPSPSLSLSADRLADALRRALVELFRAFPHPLDEDLDWDGITAKRTVCGFSTSLPEFSQEIFSMFCACVLYEQLPPHAALSHSDDALLQYREALQRVLCEPAVWQRVLFVVDAYTLQCDVTTQHSQTDNESGADRDGDCERERLSRAQRLPLLPTYEERESALREFEREIPAAVRFLEGRDWPEYAQNDALEARLWRERAMSRIAQCASLVRESHALAHATRSHNGSDAAQSENPFADLGGSASLSLLVLSPHCVPASLRRSHTPRTSQTHSGLRQSCVANVCVDVVRIDPSTDADSKTDAVRRNLRLQFVANRDIYTGDTMSYQFFDKPSTTEVFGQKGCFFEMEKRRFFYSNDDEVETEDTGCHAHCSRGRVALCECECVRCAFALFGEREREKLKEIRKDALSISVQVQRFLSQLLGDNHTLSHSHTQTESKSERDGELPLSKRARREERVCVNQTSFLAQLCATADAVLRERRARTHAVSHTNAHNLGPSLSEEECVVARALRSLGDHSLISQHTTLGVATLAQLLHWALSLSHRNTESSTAAQTLTEREENTGDRALLFSCDAHTRTFFAEVCLSLGVLGFDTLSLTQCDSHSDRQRESTQCGGVVWTIDMIVSLYRLGLALLAQNTDAQTDIKGNVCAQLSDLVAKFDVYGSLCDALSSLPHNAATHIAERFPYTVLYEEDRLRACVTDVPVLSTAECQRLIDCAERSAQRSSEGWSTGRHYSVPTTDIALHSLCDTDTVDWFVRDVLRERLKPLLLHQFFLSHNTQPCLSSQNKHAQRRAVVDMQMYVNDVFVVKYSSTQRSLPLHSDQSSHSLTIALNAEGEFVGGGTYLAATQRAVRPAQGCVTSFCGELLHAGDPLLSGVRYIVAAFFVLLPVYAVSPRGEHALPHDGESENESATVTTVAPSVSLANCFHNKASHTSSTSSGPLFGGAASDGNSNIDATVSVSVSGGGGFSFGFSFD